MENIFRFLHRSMFPLLAGIALVALSGASSVASDAPVLDFDDPPSHLPYTLEPGSLTVRRLMNWGHSYASAALDVDGDGVSEYVSGTTPYIQIKEWVGTVLTSMEQFNLPGRFTGADPCAWVDGAWDLDDDGLAEVVVGSRSDDGGEIRFWALDPTTQKAELEFGVPVGRDITDDGIWDGVYGAVGMMDVPTPAGPVRALLMICLVRYDEFGRRLFAVDARDGTELWSLPLANNPDHATTLVRDVDGDGADEIIMVGNAPRNLDEEDGDQVGGLRDDVVRIYGLETDGSVSWRTDLDVPCTRTSMVLDDLDGDGRLELAVATTNSLLTNAVSILDPVDGSVRAAWPSRNGVQGMVAVDRPDGGRDLVYGTMDGGLHRLGFDGAGFVDRVMAMSSDRVNVFGVCDLLPEPGAEILMTLTSRRVIVLTGDGRWMVDVVIDSGSIKRSRPMTLLSGEPTLLVPRYAQNGSNWIAARVPSPRSPYRAVALALGALASATAAWRWRRGRSPAPLLSLRDRRLALLERLQLAGHGRIGALQTVRRLEVKIILMSGAAERPRAMQERVRELIDRLRDETLPRLDATIELALAAEVPEHRVGRALAALDDLRALAEGDLAGGEAGPELARKLRDCAAEVEGAFVKIRDEALAEFTAPLATTWKRVGEELCEQVAEAGAVVRIAGGPAVDVGADPEDLEFMLENLLANALRAVEGSVERRVDVGWEVADGMAVVRVSDTGCGIAPDDWERVLETRASTREGGGIGLPRSNEILRRFGGRIRIIESAPGEGTVVEIELPVVRAVPAR